MAIQVLQTDGIHTLHSPLESIVYRKSLDALVRATKLKERMHFGGDPPERGYVS